MAASMGLSLGCDNNVTVKLNQNEWLLYIVSAMIPSTFTLWSFRTSRTTLKDPTHQNKTLCFSRHHLIFPTATLPGCAFCCGLYRICLQLKDFLMSLLRFKMEVIL